MDLTILTPKIIFEIILRWSHILFGMTWVGFLYWFIFVNTPFQKSLDADTKSKINPNLILPVLFYFRWAAFATFLTGLIYYISILHGESANVLKTLFTWFALIGISYFIIFKLIQPKGILNNGFLLAICSILVIVITGSTLYFIYQKLGLINNATYSIGFGGGIGIYMLLNVWGIIWPSQKRILGLKPLKEGEEISLFSRKVYLTSRMNAWLSLPMLFFMTASSHLQFMRWGY